MGVTIDWATIDGRIDGERQRRMGLKASGKDYHYWRERGDKEPPYEEHWCNWCAGWFGVPHDFDTHKKGKLCRNIHSATDSRPDRCRQCACIDCVVAERMMKESVAAVGPVTAQTTQWLVKRPGDGPSWGLTVLSSEELDALSAAVAFEVGRRAEQAILLTEPIEHHG